MTVNKGHYIYKKKSIYDELFATKMTVWDKNKLILVVNKCF